MASQVVLRQQSELLKSLSTLRAFLESQAKNVVFVAGGAAFIPGQGFEDIYESRKTLFHFFTNMILTY